LTVAVEAVDTVVNGAGAVGLACAEADGAVLALRTAAFGGRVGAGHRDRSRAFIAQLTAVRGLDFSLTKSSTRISG